MKCAICEAEVVKEGWSRGLDVEEVGRGRVVVRGEMEAEVGELGARCLGRRKG